MLPQNHLCPFFSQSYKYLAAQYFRIGIRRFAQKIFIAGLHRKYGGIYARQRCGKGYKFVSAEIEFYRNRLFVAVLYVALNGANRNFRFNHTIVFPKNY